MVSGRRLARTMPACAAMLLTKEAAAVGFGHLKAIAVGIGTPAVPKAGGMTRAP